MAFPAIQKFTAPGMLLNQTITFVSLLTTLGTYITGITNQAIAKGYTVAGSSNGVTAAMDGVNRCTNAAGFAVRAANTTTAQSWIVITAANGAQTLFTFTGASDDICRITGSPGGLFVVAGTATFAPTATDEVPGISATSIIGSTASGNRVFNVQIDSAHNGWRAFLFRSGIMAGPLIWGELFDPAFIVGPGTTCAVPVWWGCVTTASVASINALCGSFGSNSCGGSTRMIVGGVSKQVDMGATCKATSGGFSQENNISQILNGGTFFNRSLGLHSVTVTANGDVGRRYDWQVSNEFKACGELDATKTWVGINVQTAAGNAAMLLMPWDGSSAVQTT